MVHREVRPRVGVVGSAPRQPGLIVRDDPRLSGSDLRSRQQPRYDAVLGTITPDLGSEQIPRHTRQPTGPRPLNQAGDLIADPIHVAGVATDVMRHIVGVETLDNLPLVHIVVRRHRVGAPLGVGGLVRGRRRVLCTVDNNPPLGCPRTLVATRRPVIDITVDRHHYLLTQYARCGSALTARRCVNCMPPEPRNSALPDQDGLLTRAASSVSST